MTQRVFIIVLQKKAILKLRKSCKNCKNSLLNKIKNVITLNYSLSFKTNFVLTKLRFYIKNLSKAPIIINDL